MGCCNSVQIPKGVELGDDPVQPVVEDPVPQSVEKTNQPSNDLQNAISETLLAKNEGPKSSLHEFDKESSQNVRSLKQETVIKSGQIEESTEVVPQNMKSIDHKASHFSKSGTNGQNNLPAAHSTQRIEEKQENHTPELPEPLHDEKTNAQAKEENVFPVLPQKESEDLKEPKETKESKEPKEPNLIERKAILKNEVIVPEVKLENKKKKSENMDKIIVGPEIFIQLKDEKIYSKYTQGQILGQGAFGMVSLVTQKSTGFLLVFYSIDCMVFQGIIRAMKTIKKNSLILEEEKKIFSELVILKGLDHPHIVKLYELFQDFENYYLITEYCEGGELFERIQMYDHFNERIAADLMKQVLQAVVYCHSQNIVHRDLKPENILFDSKKSTGILKIIDFGTSRKFDPNKKMRKLMGTPYYIAPEVLGRKYNEKCDVWSCGVILYILLCGYPPFTGNSEQEIFTKIQNGHFVFPEQEWNKISKEAKALIKKMLELNIDKRISAAEALSNPWIQKNKSNIPIPDSTLKNIYKFEATHKIQAAIYTFIVSQIMSASERGNLQKTFMNLDKNGDRKLSEEELVEAYTQVYGNPTEALFIVKKILKATDHNGSGKIDYTEFLVAATNREKILSTNRMEQAFKMFDSDGNGFLTKNELKNVIGSEAVNEAVWNELLEECDTNKDGKISLPEFVNLLTTKKNLTIDLDKDG